MSMARRIDAAQKEAGFALAKAQTLHLFIKQEDVMLPEPLMRLLCETKEHAQKALDALVIEEG